MIRTGRTYLPVRRPRPSGEYANTVTPSSRAACKAPIFGSSPSKVNGEYSIWIADIGWTLYARRRVSPVHSQRPMYLTLPSLQRTQLLRRTASEGVADFTSSAIAPTVCSMGTVGSALIDNCIRRPTHDINWLWMRTCAHSTSLSGQHRVSRETSDRLP
jgi:hypothetical protein